MKFSYYILGIIINENYIYIFFTDLLICSFSKLSPCMQAAIFSSVMCCFLLGDILLQTKGKNWAIHASHSKLDNPRWKLGAKFSLIAYMFKSCNCNKFDKPITMECLITLFTWNFYELNNAHWLPSFVSYFNLLLNCDFFMDVQKKVAVGRTDLFIVTKQSDNQTIRQSDNQTIHFWWENIEHYQIIGFK